MKCLDYITYTANETGIQREKQKKPHWTNLILKHNVSRAFIPIMVRSNEMFLPWFCLSYNYDWETFYSGWGIAFPSHIHKHTFKHTPYIHTIGEKHIYIVFFVNCGPFLKSFKWRLCCEWKSFSLCRFKVIRQGSLVWCARMWVCFWRITTPTGRNPFESNYITIWF